ncbi:MAG: carboxymuconolactone decarboxylase family protein [Gemmatimonadota bacterium]|nr:carboxymuconolactone decarboxylase family protein [Gemmatimonadota bacterium]
MEGQVETFAREREEGNRRVAEADNLTLNRFFALDHRAYEDGALPARTKELLGLAASMVLRCDDCIRYHLTRCREEGVGREELHEALAVSLVVGGSIVIPHLRRALAFLEELDGPDGSGPA